MDRLKEHIVQYQMESKVVLSALDFLSPIGHLLFFMSYGFEMHSQAPVKVLRLFIYQLERKIISRIFELSDAVYGSGLLEFKQRDSKTKLVKESSLAMFLIPHEISYGMMLSHNVVRLLFTVYSMKGSMTFPPNHSALMHNTCLGYRTVLISQKLKVL